MKGYMKKSQKTKNIDKKVVEGFGEEWHKFDQTSLSKNEHEALFNAYFHIFPWDKLPADSIGFDLGCGSGRWAKLVAPRVGQLHCIDASEIAITVAKNNLANYSNCSFHLAGVDNIPIEDGSADFGYSLGVLHHVPDTESGIKNCTTKLKHGAPFLIYLYYAFDNKPYWYRMIWKITEMGRLLISRLPFSARYLTSQIIAILVYWPIGRLALLFESCGMDVDNFPLCYYRRKSLYVMRTDALDRFGTRLEKRFTKKQILEMMEKAGLENISFSISRPYWTAIGFKK